MKYLYAILIILTAIFASVYGEEPPPPPHSPTPLQEIELGIVADTQAIEEELASFNITTGQVVYVALPNGSTGTVDLTSCAYIADGSLEDGPPPDPTTIVPSATNAPPVVVVIRFQERERLDQDDWFDSTVIYTTKDTGFYRILIEKGIEKGIEK